MPESVRPRVLYIAYWGAAEPLGQSLVLPAVKKLAALGAELTLVTFEKPSDIQRREVMAEVSDSLARHGVRWIPLRYHKRPKVPATFFDILQGFGRSLLAEIGSRPDIIHARTFVGGLMGMMLAPALGAKLVYHNEGFYPDEQVDAGVWKAGSSPHRIAKSLERKMYARADAIIALSHKAKGLIESLPPIQRKQTPVIVVPSCVDLDHFSLNPSKRLTENGALRFVYIGSIGGRYSLDRVGRFVFIASRVIKQAHLRVLTRSEASLIASMLATTGLPDDTWSVDSVPHQVMPGELARQHVGLHFLPQGLSDHAGSPTKIGEYWAAGLPVVVTSNAGDTDEIIRREGVGVIVEEHSDDSYRRAALQLQSLLEDPDLPNRCRRAAESYYALEQGCDSQFQLYKALLSRSSLWRAQISETSL